MKKIIYLLFFLVTTNFPQTLLLEENFDFEGLLTNNGWNAHSGSGTNPISTTTGLVFDSYPSSSIGNAADLAENGEDVNRTFNSQNSGSVYLSFLVKVDNSRNGYFLHFGTSAHHGRVHLVGTSTPFAFGLEKGPSSSINSTSSIFSVNMTYLLVLKYTFNEGVGDDEVKLFVFNGEIPSTEPESAALTNNVGNDAISIGSISLRQYDSSQRIIIPDLSGEKFLKNKSLFFNNLQKQKQPFVALRGLAPPIYEVSHT